MSAVDERSNLLTSHMERINSGMGHDLFRFIQGKGQVVGKNQVEVNSADGTKNIEADYIILATGSVPRKLPHLRLLMRKRSLQVTDWTI